MANSKSQENHFYAYNMAKLIESTKRRKELEANFDKSKRLIYDEVCDDQISYAVELLKMGVDSELKDGKVSILADNGELIDFSSEEISEKVGDGVFSIMFPKEKKDEPTEEDLEFLDDEIEVEDKKADYLKKENVVNDMQRNMLMNSMSLFYPMQMMQMMQMMQPPIQPVKKEPGYNGDPLKAVQLQLEELKASRDKIKEKAIYYKKEYQKYKEKYENSEKENEELDKVSIEQINEIKNEKENLSNEIEQLKENIRTKEKELKDYEESVNCLKSELGDKERTSEEYKQKIQENLKGYESIIAQKEQELKNKTAELNRINEELCKKEKEHEEKALKLKETEELLNASKEKIEKHEKEKQQLAEKVKALKMENTKLEKELTDYQEKIDSANSTIKHLRQQITSMSSSQDDNKKMYESLKIENNSLKEREEKLQNENSSLKNENSSLENKFRKLQDENSSLKNENDSLENKSKELQDENSTLKNKNSELDDSNSKFKEQIETKKKEIKELKEEVSILKEAAYKDSNFEINSKAGFNKFFYDKKKHIQIVALVDVCEMKGINDEFGEDIGNNVIQLTIDELVNAFGKDNVYRIRGAQFGIIVENGSYSKVRETLQNVKKSLSDVQEFDIVYGIVSVNKYSSRGEAIKKARNEMQQMKKEREETLNVNGYAQENSYANQNQTNNYEEEDRQENIPKNPYVAVDMMREEPYGDDTNVQELDATKIDLAKQIMELANS